MSERSDLKFLLKTANSKDHKIQRLLYVAKQWGDSEHICQKSNGTTFLGDGLDRNGAAYWSMGEFISFIRNSHEISLTCKH